MILSVRNFQQKYQKQSMDLNMTFVDIVKAFHTFTQSAVIGFGISDFYLENNVWLSSQVYSNGSAVH